MVRLDQVGLDLGRGDTRTAVLQDLSFDVPEGGFRWLLGESGAGKTSLLRLLCLSALFTVCSAAPALADTCEGHAPATGAKIEGVVLHVEDGQRLCLAKGPTPDQWTEVQVLQGSETVRDVQIAKASLMNAAFPRR